MRQWIPSCVPRSRPGALGVEWEWVGLEGCVSALLQLGHFSLHFSVHSLSFHLMRMFLGKTKTKPPERQRCEMGVGGLPWEAGVEMMSPLPGIQPWSTLPQASPPQFTQVNKQLSYLQGILWGLSDKTYYEKCFVTHRSMAPECMYPAARPVASSFWLPLLLRDSGSSVHTLCASVVP